MLFLFLTSPLYLLTHIFASLSLYIYIFVSKGKESDPTDASVDTSANASVDSQLTVGWQSADRRPTGGQLSTDCRPTRWPLFKLIRYEIHWWCVGGVLVTPLGLMELFSCLKYLSQTELKCLRLKTFTGIRTTKCTFDRHLVFHVIRTQFPLRQVLLEPSSH